ncbi:MAG: shikimate dehydrogenase [Actinomycetota bacterium]
MKLVLLGDPVSHSLSPAIHNAGLAAAGIEGTYEARRVDEDGMREAVSEVRYGRLDGANVTMPHKHLAFELADRVSEDALRSGAVNTFVRAAGEVWGHNTDIVGLRAVWDETEFSTSAPVLVLGTGGAAAAAVVARSDAVLFISGRRPEAAADVLAVTRTRGEVVPWGSAIAGAVVVNATPIGMKGEALPDGILNGASGLVDMAYGPEPTPAVLHARATGLPVIDGPGFLLAQAVAAFELWTGVTAPVDAMRDALHHGE